MKNYKLSLLILMFFSMFVFSCEKEDARKDEEIVKLEEYIKTNKITVSPTKSGLYYIEIEKGTGEQAAVGKYVKVRYTGTLIDGSIFDSNNITGKPPLSFIIGESDVIEGWHEGIALMKEGGKATLIIPSEIGYGDEAFGIIEAYSTLIFEIEVLDVF